MKNIISTWIYIEEKLNESNYPQVKGNSSSLSFQEVYWRCVIVFFETSLRFNKDARHILFTNSKVLPVINGFDFKEFLRKNEIEIVTLELSFKTPTGYYQSWRNQFYVFDILNYIVKEMNEEDKFLLLDSDCIFNNSSKGIFQELDKSEALSYKLWYPENTDINGISRNEMKVIFKDLGINIKDTPFYFGGEVFIAKKSFIKKVVEDFPNLWDTLILKFENQEIKFNEEAHVLSYYYYKYDIPIGSVNKFIKRCWTDPFNFRNIIKQDYHLDILHLPAEKEHGIKNVFKLIASGEKLASFNDKEYKKLINKTLSGNKFITKLPKRVISKFFN